MLERPEMPNLSTSSRPAEKPNLATWRRYVKIGEAADYLGVTDRTIRQMIADGRLTGYRNGQRLVRVDLHEVDEAMKPFGGGAA